MTAESRFGDFKRFLGFEHSVPPSTMQNKRSKAMETFPAYARSSEEQERRMANFFREALHNFDPSGGLKAMRYWQRSLSQRRNPYTGKEDSTVAMDLSLIDPTKTALILRFDAHPILPEDRLKGQRTIGPLRSKGVRLIQDYSQEGKISVEYLIGGDPEYDKLGERERGGWVHLEDNPEYQEWLNSTPRPTIAQQLEKAVYYSEHNFDNRTGISLGDLSGYTTGDYTKTRRIIFNPSTNLAICQKLPK